MSRFVYDGYLGNVASLDAETATMHVIGPGYSPDPTHVDLTDIDPGDILGAETSTLTVAVTSNTLTVTCTSNEVEVDPVDEVTPVQGVVWTWNDGVDDLLVFWVGLDAPELAVEPQTFTFTTGIYTLDGGA